MEDEDSQKTEGNASRKSKILDERGDILFVFRPSYHFIHILGCPGEAVTGFDPLDAQFFGALELAPASGFGFYKLDHAGSQTLPVGAHQQAERGSGFAFALARMNDNQSVLCFTHGKRKRG